MLGNKDKICKVNDSTSKEEKLFLATASIESAKVLLLRSIGIDNFMEIRESIKGLECTLFAIFAEQCRPNEWGEKWDLEKQAKRQLQEILDFAKGVEVEE